MKVKELLSSEDKWTKGASARDACGLPCESARSHKAVCWCLTGAIDVCYPSAQSNNRVMRKVYGKITDQMEYEWNDAPERTHAEVIALANELDI